MRVVSEDSGEGAGDLSTNIVASLLTGRGGSPEDEAAEVVSVSANTGAD